MKRSSRLGLVWASSWCLAASSAFAQEAGSSSGGSQGSFQPPVAHITNEATYLSAAGLVAFADPMLVYGTVISFGKGWGKSEHPVLGFETNLALVSGSGKLDNALQGVPGGPSLELSILSTVGSFLLKVRPLDLHETGWVGLTAYAGPTIGLQRLSTTTALGTARSGSMVAGAAAGAVVDFAFRDLLDGFVFGGGRAMAFGRQPGATDTIDFEPVAFVMPEYGGNLAVHLPYGLDLTLAALFNLMRRDEDEKENVKTFILGLVWQKDAGFSPIIDGELP